MLTIEAWGRIEGGKLTLSNRKRFESDLKECKDQEVIVIVKKRGKRSDKQNRYYWGVCLFEIRLRLKELGYRLTSDEIHAWLKEKMIPNHIVDDNGVILMTVPGSTATMNKSEFGDYVDRVRQWALETIDCNIPDADASLAMDF